MISKVIPRFLARLLRLSPNSYRRLTSEEKFHALGRWIKAYDGQLSRFYPEMPREMRSQPWDWLMPAAWQDDYVSAFDLTLNGKASRGAKFFANRARRMEARKMKPASGGVTRFAMWTPGGLWKAAAAADLLAGGEHCASLLSRAIDREPRDIALQEWLGDWLMQREQSEAALAVYSDAADAATSLRSVLEDARENASAQRPVSPGRMHDALMDISDNEARLDRLLAKIASANRATSP